MSENIQPSSLHLVDHQPRHTASQPPVIGPPLHWPPITYHCRYSLRPHAYPHSNPLAAPTWASEHVPALPPPLVQALQAETLLVEDFNPLQVSSEEVRDVKLVLRGALITNMRGDPFCIGVPRRIRPQTFTSPATEAQPGFYKSVWDIFRTRGIPVEPAGFAHNAPLSIKVTMTIWPVAGNAITDSYERI